MNNTSIAINNAIADLIAIAETPRDIAMIRILRQLKEADAQAIKLASVFLENFSKTDI
jgi:flagellar basal body P-ring protein FlgI